MAIDAHQRVIYVGTFSKSLFPGLRLGYAIAPPGLVDGFIAAHLSTDMHAHTIEQAVVADFIDQGHFARHLRRMRIVHLDRQHSLIRHAERLTDTIELSPSDGGLHLVGQLANGRTTVRSRNEPSGRAYTSGHSQLTTFARRPEPGSSSDTPAPLKATCATA